MSNPYFQFKQFTIRQDRCAMKVTTDACLFGAWISEKAKSQKSKVKNVLDIGCGTSLLSLLLAQKNKDVIIDAIEIDKEAAEQAKQNVAASPWNDRINIINADARSFPFSKKYDLIISNPPFYENELRSENDSKNIAHHSNDLGLRELLSLTKNLLTGTGTFCFLFPYKRKDEIERSLKACSLFIYKLLLVKQSVKHDYFRVMIEGGLKEIPEIITEEISIWDSKQQYTKEFAELLKEYYLYL